MEKEKVTRNNGGGGTINTNNLHKIPYSKEEDIIKAQKLVACLFGSENTHLAREAFEALGILEEYRNK
ncbi:hypothetical protein KA043_03565 [Candidatus Saccharibacteria bacterium]|nr:hypothetical protein [Candidatus Saccharibacteria bacterium]